LTEFNTLIKPTSLPWDAAQNIYAFTKACKSGEEMAEYTNKNQAFPAAWLHGGLVSLYVIINAF
jgi:hypothetical protein